MTEEKVSMLGTLTLPPWGGSLQSKQSAIYLVAELHNIKLKFSADYGWWSKLHIVATGLPQDLDKFIASVEFVLGKKIEKD